MIVAMPFADVDEAIRLANGTPYGLIAAIWTHTLALALALALAHRMAAELRSGQVYVNRFDAGGGLRYPFGGYGKSGYGREKGVEALLAYTQTKTVAIKLPPRTGP